MPRLARAKLHEGGRQSAAYCSRPAIIWPNYRPTCTGPRAARVGPNYAYRTTTAADNENRQEPTTADNDNLSGPGQQQQQQEDATATVAVAVAAGARLAAACR